MNNENVVTQSEIRTSRRRMLGIIGGTAALSGIAGAGVGTVINSDRRGSSPLQGSVSDSFTQVPDTDIFGFYDKSYDFQTFSIDEMDIVDFPWPNEGEIIVLYSRTDIEVGLLQGNYPEYEFQLQRLEWFRHNYYEPDFYSIDLSNTRSINFGDHGEERRFAHFELPGEEYSGAVIWIIHLIEYGNPQFPGVDINNENTILLGTY